MSDTKKQRKPRMAKGVNVGLNEILVVQEGGEIAQQVVQSLRDKKYATKVITGFSNLESALKTLTEPIILIESGVSEANLDRCAKLLGKAAAGIPLPVILIGGGADSYERALDKLFPAATTLNTPYGSAEILAAINYLSRTYIDRKAKRAAGAKMVEELRASAEARSPKLPTGPTVPQSVFEQLQKLDLWNRPIGGDLYSGIQMDVKFLTEKGMVPKDVVIQEVITNLCFDAGKWGRGHLARVSYMAQKILESMNPEEALMENLKTSALLFAWSFAGNSAELLKRPYQEMRSQQMRLELCSKIKDSAMSISSQLRQKQAADIVATMARLIGGEQGVSDDDVCITASAIMAADMTSRFCFPGGLWNPRKANHLFLKLKQSRFQEMHPAVLGCIVKFLAEALSSHTRVVLLPKTLRADKAALEEMARQLKLPVEQNEKRVEISELTPGMQLSRPIVAMDGREILSCDIQLDEDLIWRLWQLSAVRPLNAPVIVNTKN